MERMTHKDVIFAIERPRIDCLIERQHLRVGDRVRVSIPNFERWAFGAAECLHGLTGTIEQFKESDFTDGLEALVQFDAPAKTWHPYQTPWVAGWFRVEELLKNYAKRETL